MTKQQILSCLFACFSPISLAGEFTGEGGLGLTITDGNSNTKNINASLTAKYAAGKLHHNFELLINQAESTNSAGVTTETADSIKYAYKLDYKLNNKSYLWASYINDSNVYAGYDPRTSISAGYGYIWVKNDKTLLTTELGFGTQETDAVGAAPTFTKGLSSDESITHLALNYEHKVNTNVQFIQKLLFQLGDDNNYTESFSALKIAMSNKLALQLNYLLKKNSETAAHIDDTDSTTAVTLVYGF